ncbi:VOC family protein [Microbacterium aurantiacum]|uniref:VOC family protein n=1 Tax=Microbacterium aurantiacum TaxID=162393 RepID=UPI000C805CF9|nr:VOC family protein [Microbacterium aurantiacum]
MAGLVPYLFFPGTAAEALTFYHGVFGGELDLHTYAEFARTDGPGDAIAHGEIRGPVELFAADAGPDQDAVHVVGAVFSLLGTADPETLTRWFAALADRGTALDPMQKRQWGAHDGQVTDRFGIRWLVGYED